MACAREHWFLLDLAIQASPWRPPLLEQYGGWRAGTSDPLNRMATLADEIGDWLWHKPPWSEVALECGSRAVAADLEAGDGMAAALKAAYLSHLVIDALAVSHVWLDLLAEHEDFADTATLRRLHDPVENVVIEPLEALELQVETTEDAFAEAYKACKKEATEIAREVVVDYRTGHSALSHSLSGTRNSAKAMALYFEAVATGQMELSGGLDGEPRLRRWPGRELLSWDGERLVAALSERELSLRLRSGLGWNGRNIFFEPWGCSREARQDLWLFRQDRAEWRARWQ